MTAPGREQLFAPGAVRVKICGVTNPADAAMAVRAGADAIGINLFRGSKRFVELADAVGLAAEIPVTRVAVVVNATADELRAITETGCFEAVQFHGDETAEFCRDNAPRWLRAVRVSGAAALTEALAYQTPWLLLDAHCAAGYGGTGLTVDPEVAARFVSGHPERRTLLAGGLRPETVAAAVAAVRPHGVDVASGVEVEGKPRVKDAGKVRAFLEAVREGRRF